MSRPIYVDSGTGKIRGPTNTRDWYGGGGDGNPGDNIQPVGPSNLPGSGTDYARDDHVHEGVARINAATGDLVILPGYNMTTTQLGQDIEVARQNFPWGSIQFDSGPCGSELPALAPLAGACSGNMVPILGIWNGVSGDGVTVNPLGMLDIVESGLYCFSFDVSLITEEGIQAKIVLAQVPALTTHIKAMGTTLNFCNEISASGFLWLNAGASMVLLITISSAREQATIYQAIFSAYMVYRTV